MRDLKILITGAAGFIGSHIVDCLLDEDYEVKAIDNLSTGKIDNIAKYMDRKDFQFIKGDILDYNLLENITKDIDVIFHQAALASVPISIKKPILTNDINVTGTLNLLKICTDLDVRRFIFASSAAVYGETETLINENTITNPTNPYGVSKLAAEKYIEIFHKLFGLNTICLRNFNVYGPRQPSGGVIDIFIQRLINGKAPIIYGDGEQIRDFVNIKDIVKANFLALEKSNAQGAFNIASGKCVTINRLAAIITQQISKDIKPIYVKERPGDPKGGGVDISKAKEVLGFDPKISLREGITDVLNWKIQQLNILK